MENTPDVNGNPSPVASEGVISQTQLPEVPVVTPIPVTPPVGSQTPPENLYAALAEERRLRKEAEDKLNNLNTTTPTDEVYSDEGRMLKTKLDSVENEVRSLREERDLERLYNQFPLLKEKASEFLEYRNAEHPKAKLESVAKLFLSEQGLFEPVRKGLENPTGGQRVPQTSEMTSDEIKHLRETNYKLYLDKLRKGLIKV